MLQASSLCALLSMKLVALQILGLWCCCQGSRWVRTLLGHRVSQSGTRCRSLPTGNAAVWISTLEDLRARHRGKGNLFRAGWREIWHVVLFYILAQRSGTSNVERGLGTMSRQGAKSTDKHLAESSSYSQAGVPRSLSSCFWRPCVSEAAVRRRTCVSRARAIADVQLCRLLGA
jgi:hypothetical protein